MSKCLEFTKDIFFEDLIVKSNASNVILAPKAHQQSPTYFGSIIGGCIDFNVCFPKLNCLHGMHEANQPNRPLFN